MGSCEFFYDFSSPFAYLGATQVDRLLAGHQVIWRPFLLGALFKEIGAPNVPLQSYTPAKQKILLLDQHRWADHWGVEFKFPDKFPQRTVTALRLALQVPERQIAPLSVALFRVMWAENGDLEDRATLERVLSAQGLDAARLLAGCDDPEVKARLKANTDRAVALGLCGAPSFVVGERVFWGQDRLEFVKRALEGWIPRFEAAAG
jgi:2-hydroxychromene-2-carboxylate isomerase